MNLKNSLTPFLSTSVGTAWFTGGICKIFKTFLLWSLEVVFPPRRHQRNQQGWYESSMRWTDNYTRLTQNNQSGKVTFKCQKALRNISLSIKESLKTENRTQYSNCQLSNQIKNQIYPNMSHNKSFCTNCTMR